MVNCSSPRNMWLVCVFSLLILVATATGSLDCGNLNKYVYIRHQKSGLVIDAKNSTYLTLQVPNATETQQWQLLPSSRIGLFNIINKYSEKALDVGARIIDTTDTVWFRVSLNPQEDSVYQQWFINSNGTIGNNGWFELVLTLFYYAPALGNELAIISYEDLLYDTGFMQYSLDLVE